MYSFYFDFLCAMGFQTTINIRGYHCDAYGHVNNARYLELFEEARWRLLEESGVLELAKAKDYLFFIVHLELSFKKPVMDGEQITILSSTHEIARKTVTFKQQITNVAGQLCTEAFIKFVLFDSKENQSVAMNPEIEGWFKNFE